MLVKLLSVLVLTSVASAILQPDVRTIDSGSVQGIFDTQMNIRYWLGIPYAATTGGVNRFKAPQPVTPWGSQTLNATWWGPGCSQTHGGPDVPTVQSEDCLNLNVFVPGGTKPSSKLPVMLWIHGGAFMEGSNQGPFYIYNGSHISTMGNVAVVSINYRLGAFGFLVTDTLRGNYGFLDQRAAMQWVQRNIAVFGGDPTQVTLFGESAGGMSIGLHIISPNSKGLFSKAIMESNPTGMLFHTIPQGQVYGRTFCDVTNCTTGKNQCSETCLRSLTTDQVKTGWRKAGDSTIDFILANWEHLIDGAVMQFAPVVDGVEIPTQVVQALRAGNFNPVPILEGVNREDGTTFVYIALPDTPLPVFAYELATDVVFAPHGKEIIQRYADPTQKDGRWLFGEVLTDYLFRCSSDVFAAETSKRGQPAFSYRYKHILSASWIWKQFGLPAFCANATCHMAEVPMVFGNEVHTQALNVSFTPAEVTMSNNIINYWTSFARYGDPNKAGNVPFVWPAYDATKRQNLLLDEQLATEDSVDLCNFWDSIGYVH